MLFFVAENLEQRIGEFSARLRSLFGGSAAQAINLIMFYAAHVEKYDGAVHATRSRIVTLAMPERWGVMGIVCLDESPLLSMISLVMPAIAMGSRVLAVPSTTSALIATDFYQVIETSAVLGVICGAALLSDQTVSPAGKHRRTRRPTVFANKKADSRRLFGYSPNLGRSLDERTLFGSGGECRIDRPLLDSNPHSGNRVMLVCR